MNNTFKKIVASITALTCAVWMVGPGIASATAEEDLQATIDSLLAQVAALQVQIDAAGGTTAGGAITGVPSDFTFDASLKLGDTGDAVKYLQIVLNSNSATQLAASGIGSAGNETSYFGQLTKTAVVGFQEEYAEEVLASYGLTEGTGFVGSTTRAKLNSLLTAGTTSVTLPAGCTSTAGYSSTTGVKCDTGETTPVVTLPAGCTSTAGYSPTTGVKCDGGTTTPVVAPLTVALAEDTPPAANVQKGSAANTVVKLVFTAGDSAVSVTGLTLQSYGTTEATGSTDVSAVSLSDEQLIPVGTSRTPAGNQVNFVIVPALSIPANSSRTISVKATIGSGAGTMAVIRYGLASATAITSNAVFGGNYPVVGNSFMIVPAGQLGALSVSKYETLPKTTAKVGEANIVINQSTISAGSNEGLVIGQVTLTNTGSCVGSDIANIRLRNNGTVVGGPATLSIDNKVIFNLTTPVTLVAGSSANFDVIADIAGGGTNGRTIITNIAVGGAVAQGLASGTNIINTAASTVSSTVTIGNEAVIVSMSASHPQGASGYFIETTNKKDLAVFDVRATGGSVIFNTISMYMVNSTSGLSATNYISSVGLYDGDALVSNLTDVIVNTTNQTFSLNWTVPANTTRTLVLKGVTSTLDVADPDTITTTFSGYTAYGLSSGVALTSTTDVASTAITVYAAGTVTAVASTTLTPYSQAILAPSNGVTLAALKIYAQREDMKLTNLTVTIDGTAYADESAISSMTLYADNGTTQLTTPVTYDDTADDTTDTFTFSASDFISDIIFTKNAYKSILVKANVASTMNGSSAITLNVAATAAHLKFIGQDSGSTKDYLSAFDLHITSPYAGGTYSSDTKVVTIEKAAASPSGSISRGSQTVTGIWDVENADSLGAAAVLTGITFTSKTGLPSALTDADDDTLFSLYDGDGNLLAGGTGDDAGVTLVKADGTVAFSSVGLTINTGEPKQLKLLVNTTSLTLFVQNVQLQWSVEVVADATVTDGAVGYANGTWSIPATANVITLP